MPWGSDPAASGNSGQPSSGWGSDAPAPAQGSGIMQNLGAGAVKGLTGLTTFVLAPGEVGADIGNAIADTFTPREAAPPQGLQVQHRLNQAVGAVTGYNPESTVAATPGERIAQGIGAGAVGAFIPGAGELTVGRMIANGLIGATSGASGAGLAEVAPDNLKPAANLVGSLVGGLGAAGGLEAAAAGGRGLAATAAPFIARVSPEAAEAQAGQVLANRATDLPAVRSTLEVGPQEIVPGSHPTTFQQTGDVGLGALEREVAVRNADQFAERRGDQNAARVTSLNNLQAGADPNEVATYLKAQFADLNTDADAHVANVTAAAQAKADALGGIGAPEAHGEATRALVQEAENSARARESGLWKAVDPNGDLTGNVSETVGAAKRILGELPTTAKPMAGEESGIFAAASELPALAPVSDLIALRSRVSTELRNELIANGRSPAYARLSQLRGAIQDNLANTISQQVQNEASAVSRGALDPSETTANRVQSWLNDDRQQAAAGADLAAGTGGYSAGPATADARPNGAGLPAQERSGGPAGNPGLSDDVVPAPELARASEDVRAYRSPPGPSGSLFSAIKALGGLRLRGESGALTPDGGEIAGILDRPPPGFVNNRSGLTPEDMRQALQDRGWFGAVGADEATNQAGVRGSSVQSLQDALQQEVSGRPFFHPESDSAYRVGQRATLERDMTEAGVRPVDTNSEAAAKLAAWRRDQAWKLGEGLEQLRARADVLGVSHERATSYDELLVDVIEREAIQGHYTAEAAAEHNRQIDGILSPRDLEQLEQLARSGPIPEQAASPFAEAFERRQNPDATTQGAGGQRGSGTGGGSEGAVPTFDEAAAQRLALATEATKGRARTYGLGPTGQVLNKAGASDLYRLPDGRVPGKFFHPGPTGYSDMQALYSAVGQAKALPVIEDYAAASLRRAAMRDDGTVDPVKFARWSAAHRDSLRALPAPVRAQFADAATASRAVIDATKARAEALKAAQSGALGRVLKLDDPSAVTRVVGQVLESRNGVGDMRVLANATRGDEAARAGLRQAVADHIAQKLIGNTEAGTSGVNQIKSDAFQTFVKQNVPALREVFTPAEVTNIQAIAADLNRANRSISAVKLPGGSNTTQDFLGATKGAAHKAVGPALDVVAALVGEHLFHNPAMGVASGLAAHLLQGMRAVGIERIDQLVTSAMLHPEVARELLKRVPVNAKAPTFGPLLRALRSSAPATINQRKAA